MRKLASEIITDLEQRVARLERQSSKLPSQINATVNYFLSTLNKLGIHAEGKGNGDYSSLELNKPNLKHLISQGFYKETGSPVYVYIEGILPNRNKAPTIMFRLYDPKTRRTQVIDSERHKDGIAQFLRG
mgnify:CR=1 FL=1